MTYLHDLFANWERMVNGRKFIQTLGFDRGFVLKN